MKSRFLFYTFNAFLLLIHLDVFAGIKLPAFFTDNMVLQRDRPLVIWGWADKGEKISVQFNGQSANTRTNQNGKWELRLQPMHFGGPFEMKIRAASGTKVLKNILIGDVWLCSGQSNMEMPIQGWSKDSVRNAAKEISSANYPQIRLFTVGQSLSYTPQEDLKGGAWQVCSPANVGAFSAVGFFFGRKLQQELNIPIGLVNSSFGGTIVQAWTSWETISSMDLYRNLDPLILQKTQADQQKKKERYSTAIQKELENNKQGSINTDGWNIINLPQSYEQSAIGNTDGIVWFQKEFIVPDSVAALPATLSLGAIDDIDETYVNGKLVGKMNGWSTPRIYTIEQGLLKRGKNSIAIRVYDAGGGGGFFGKPAEMYFNTGAIKIPLSGEWKYKVAVTTSQFDVIETGPNAFPSQLYNAMIAPLIKFPIKGVIWYQGEANTGEAFRYHSLFSALINDWRAKWGYAFPFHWVQLANYLKPDTIPSGSTWAELREAQHQTLSLPNTGEAIAIDLGEANDIHPKNKQDVGLRLAIGVLKNVYKREIIATGPVFNSMRIEKEKIILTFNNAGGGLIAKTDKYQDLKGFAIAGPDHEFVWAKGYITGDNKVIVFNENIPNPVAVRYAWADNPGDANLYNKEGLPASPFRTDHWKGITTNQ